MPKKLSYIFLKISQIVSALLIVIVPVVGAHYLMNGIVKYYAQHANIWISFIIGGSLCFLLGLPIAIFDLYATRQAEIYVLNAMNKEEAKRGALYAIISGALFNVFGIVAGIFMLNTPDEEYQKELHPVDDKSFVGRAIALIGVEKHTDYVKDRANDANINSGIFMSFVIVAVEIWMIIRRFVEDLGPAWQKGVFLNSIAKNKFDDLFATVSLFILMLLLSLSMMVFCIVYTRKKLANKTKFIINIIFSALLFSYTFFVFKENLTNWKDFRHIVMNILLISLYVGCLLFSITNASYWALKYFKKINSRYLLVGVLTLFAIICLIFGVRVSYSDYNSGKEILCYVTMVIYVGCLLIWKPYTSIAILGSLFLAFYVLIINLVPKNPEFVFQDGDLVNYITLFISLAMVAISIYNQRTKDGKKDETLERLAKVEPITQLNTYSNYLIESEILLEKNIGNIILLFINIVNFKSVNDQKGFDEANKDLYRFGQLLTEIFPEGIISRMSDDHFALSVENVDLETKLKGLRLLTKEQFDLDLEIGGYIPSDKDEVLARQVDKARYASSLEIRDGKQLVIYDQEMHNGYHRMQYIIHNIEKAVENGWIKVYYQPVVLAKNGKLCGAEALVRWIDPKYGFLSPGIFVPVLENNRLIHILDRGVYEIVCRDIREAIDAGRKVIPVSMNFSRLDFALMDAIGVLNDLVKKYNIPKDLIHVEITESALMEDIDLFSHAIERIKGENYALWLDDFGSGYSSLNVLKDYEFDVLKIDMIFLSKFHEKPKSKIIIKSVIDMANALGIKTLCEGVETEEQAQFLKEAGCGKLQGYHYGKPMPKEDLYKLIDDKKFIIDLSE
ncbi:MAG: bifunctional diguanylate cyclase/phosphodiesterase [Bacilli bacterium]|nr:bifunctional diguanylate cyclase/phosphodiesterase [Bacilli bacterium]